MTGSARPNGQAIFAMLLLVLTTVYASQIFKLGLPFAKGVEPGASFLPIVLSAVMYLAAGRILIEELRKGREAVARAAQSDHVPAVGLIGPLVVALFTVGFAVGLERVGYFVAAGAYTFAVAFYFDYEESGRPLRSVLIAAITAAIITGFCWLFFVKLFGLSLPTWSF
ncbi:tripartite tricarboxylate transporter TctB family protein [Roseovarius sp. Pro17]|uniref:tripartite tricarboxylate transporter TctB family protein n=1 Tax=Roseovarius sp. Pro17 TaxID=3108175 RepID=UPI002D775050|nr:tripartite tricarboxylate transporter TctB family protein [Roseovarius sp. Pro17]